MNVCAHKVKITVAIEIYNFKTNLEICYVIACDIELKFGDFLPYFLHTFVIDKIAHV